MQPPKTHFWTFSSETKIMKITHSEMVCTFLWNFRALWLVIVVIEIVILPIVLVEHLLFGTELFQWLVQFVISVASIFVIVAVTYTMVKFSFKIVNERYQNFQ